MSFSFECNDAKVTVKKKNEKIFVSVIWTYPNELNVLESYCYWLGPYPFTGCDYNHAIGKVDDKIICPSTDITSALFDDEYKYFAIHVVTFIKSDVKYLDISSTPFELDRIKIHYNIPGEILDTNECKICMDSYPNIVLITCHKLAHAICSKCRRNMKTNECPFTRRKILYYLDIGY